MAEDGYKNFSVRFLESELRRIDATAKAFYGGRISTGEAIRRLAEERLEEIESSQGYEPTRKALLRILREWRSARILSRADLELVADLAHTAYLRCRRPFVSRELLAANVAAFREAVRVRLRGKPSKGIEPTERYFIGNLQTHDGDLGAGSFVEFLDKWLDSLVDQPSCSKAEFASRNLASFLKDPTMDSPHLGSALSAYVPALLQVAIRGYWYAERKPLLEPEAGPAYSFPVFPAKIAFGSVVVSPLIKNSELMLSIDFKDRSLSLTANDYVEVEELRDVVRRAAQGQYGQGETFSLLENTGVKDSVILFCSRVSQFVSVEEIRALNQCLDQLSHDPVLSGLMERLAYVYGQI